MPGQMLLGDLCVAWPTLARGLLGAEAGAAIIYRKELASIQNLRARDRQKRRRLTELTWGLDMLLRESVQEWLDPRDTRPFLIRALNWLANRKEEKVWRKHDNFRV